ncbi:MAG: hypothetical protein LBR36_01105 [Bacteroidales bacterium]|jgi:hypothetical protein|nr:hypothetical protein [Bacteroidales bacterium]
MRQQELKDYIKQRKHLFWYTPKDKVEDVSDELLVEMILKLRNFGRRKGIV